MKQTIKILVTVFFLCNMVAGFSQGNLLITPIRVIMENGKQKEDLTLTNIGKDSAVYMISFLHYQMLADGSFKQLDKQDSATCADNYLRIFPRKVTLPPNESQTIRLQFRKPADMKEGEFRSHLYFRAEKNVSPLGMVDVKSDTMHMAVKITPIFGISIPVIIRNGNTEAKISLSDVSLTAVNDSASRINLSINRTGNKSVYGNISVEYVPTTGKPIQVGVANGVAVYTELDKRTFSLLLNLTKDVRHKNGKLLIRYTMRKEDGGKELARTEYTL